MKHRGPCTSHNIPNPTHPTYLLVLLDIGQLWVVKSLQHLDFILVRLLFLRLPEELLRGGSGSFLYRVIMRHLWLFARSGAPEHVVAALSS